jgi:hypothetical protein
VKQCGGDLSVMALTDATALVLPCADLALYSSLEGNLPPGLTASEVNSAIEVIKDNLECAIQMVDIGADWGRKFDLPRNSCHHIIKTF